MKIRMFKLLWLTGEEVYNLRSEIQWVMYFMRVGFFILIEFFSFLIYWCFPFESRFSSFHQWNHVLWGVFWTSGIVGFLFHGCFVSVVFFCYLSNSHHFMLPPFCPCKHNETLRINICFCFFCLCIFSFFFFFCFFHPMRICIPVITECHIRQSDHVRITTS